MMIRFPQPLLLAAMLLLTVCTLSGTSAALDLFEAPAGPAANAPIEVDAEELDYDKTGGRITAVGNVVIVCGVDELRADRVLVHINSGDAYALGNVRLRRGAQDIKSARLHYNFRTRVSSLDAPSVEAEPFRILADTVTRAADGKVVLNDAKVTTCVYKHPHSHYHVRSHRLTVVPGVSLRAKGAVWYFGRVPCFYLPYWYQSLDEQSGFRFYPGYRSRWGAYLLTSYRQRLSPSLRAEHHVDYRTERGFAIGEDLRWNVRDGFGDVSLYLLDDRNPMQNDRALDAADISSERYRIRVRHSQGFGERTHLLFQVNYLSDPLILSDFFDREYRHSRQPENYVSVSHRREAFTVTALANMRLNDFYGNVNRLPEVLLDVFRLQLGNSSFYYESQSSVTGLERVWEKGSNAEDYSAFRMDTGHTVYQPRRLAGWLNVVPRAGYRATYYSAAPVARVTGEGEDAETERIDGGALLRNVFEVGSEVSFKAFKRLPGTAEKPWRHVAEPYANYSFRLEPDVLPGELYQFDGTDQLDELHQVLVGMRNKLQTKRDGVAVDVADVNIYTTLRLNAAGGQEVLDLVSLDADFRPADWMLLRMDGAYSLDASALQRFNTRFLLNQEDVWSAGIEHRYRNGISSLLAMTATFHPNRNWSFNAFGRYEFEGSRLEEQGGYVQRKLDCLGIRLGGSVLPGYTRRDGTVRDDEYRILLELWLLAFPEMGLGARYR